MSYRGNIFIVDENELMASPDIFALQQEWDRWGRWRLSWMMRAENRVRENYLTTSASVRGENSQISVLLYTTQVLAWVLTYSLVYFYLCILLAAYMFYYFNVAAICCDKSWSFGLVLNTSVMWDILWSLFLGELPVSSFHTRSVTSTHTYCAVCTLSRCHSNLFMLSTTN